MSRRGERETKIRAPTRPHLNESAFKEYWEKIRSGILQIQKKNPSSLSFEEIYRTAYYAVLYRFGDRLYNNLHGVIAEHLDGVVERQLASVPDESFLAELANCWKDHITVSTMIKDLMLYMESNYIKTANKAPILSMSLQLFRERVLYNKRHPIRERLLGVLLQEIQRERNGELVKRSLIRSSTTMLQELGIGSLQCYEADFESPFIEMSVSHYRRYSAAILAEGDVAEYLRKVEKSLADENARVQNYLAPSTGPKIRLALEEVMISAHIKNLIEMENTGVRVMIEQDRLQDLGRAYRLFARVSIGLGTLSEHVAAYIVEVGKQINADQSGSGTSAADAGEGSASSSTAQADGGSADASRPSSSGKRAASAAASSSSSSSAAAAADGDAVQGAGTREELRWVGDVLRLKARFDKILMECFGKDKMFQTTINAAFGKFINLHPKAAEYLSLYVDDRLRRGAKEASDDDMDSFLEKIVAIFRFIVEKDVFEKFYKQHLAKRLLLGRSQADDAERSIIAKFKTECGYHFTSKLEGMFNDMRVSTDVMNGFREYWKNLKQNEQKVLEINVIIGQTTFWPMSAQTARANLPAEIQSACDAYQLYYNQRYNGRKITWVKNLGSADIKARFKTRTHELTVSTYQMVILLLFNKYADNKELSYKEIAEETDIPASDLIRNLQSLACAKYKILNKSPKSKDVKETDMFSVNDGFTCKLMRIKIPVVASRAETESDRKETKEKVDEDRNFEIEAAIVRIMKSRKTMEHSNLIAEVTQQLSARFIANPIVVKKRIEGLIDREYLERSPSDLKVYRYLA